MTTLDLPRILPAPQQRAPDASRQFSPAPATATAAPETATATTATDANVAGAARAERWSLSTWLLILLAVGSALLGRLCYLARPFDNDAAIFIYMGKLIGEGGRLCHDLVDNKFPTVGLLTGVPWRLFGANWAAYVALQTVMAFVGVAVLVDIARRHVGRYAMLPTALFGLVFLNFSVGVFGGFQLETIHTFFAILAARAALEALRRDTISDALVVGLAAGMAAMAKPTGLAVAAAFALATIVHRRRQPTRIVAHGLAGAAGVAVPAAVTLAYLLASDTLRDMPGLWRQLSAYAANTIWAAADLWKPVIVASLLGFPMIVRAWAFRSHRLAPAERSPVPAVVVLFVMAWLIVEALGVAMQRRMYGYHFLPLVAPAALLFGMIPRRAHAGQLTVALLPTVLISTAVAGNVFEHATGSRLAVSEYLAQRASPGAAVWQDCTSRLLLETNLRPASRHTLTFLFVNYDAAPLEYSRQMLADFEATRPEYLVLPARMEKYLANQWTQIAELARSPVRRHNYCAAWRSLEAYARQHYQIETFIRGHAVWRRKD